MASPHYIKEMRQRLGLEENDTQRDAEIASMTPYARLRLLCGWFLGDPNWASSMLEWCNDAGFEVKPRERGDG